MSKRKQPHKEIITWLDHATCMGWYPIEQIRDKAETPLNQVIHGQTVGWVIHEDKTRVIVSPTCTEEGMCTDPFSIVKKAIVKREKIK